MNINFTGAERVIFNAHLNFHIAIGKSNEEARKLAMNKIISIRALGTQLKKRGLTK